MKKENVIYSTLIFFVILLCTLVSIDIIISIRFMNENKNVEIVKSDEVITEETSECAGVEEVFEEANEEVAAIEVKEVKSVNIYSYSEIANETADLERQKEYTRQEIIVAAKANEYKNFLDSISDDDRYLLAKIVMAESEGESLKGKCCVAVVVLNRVRSSKFPDTVGEVIMQHTGDVYQFGPIKDGRFFTHEPTDECYEAVDLVLSGEVVNKALYFTSSKEKDSWHDRNLTILFEEGGHKFYI